MNFCKQKFCNILREFLDFIIWDFGGNINGIIVGGTVLEIN